MVARVRTPPAPLERTEQAMLVKRLRLDPRTRNLLWTATAGGMYTAKRTAALMVGQGLSKGVPDLLFFEPTSYPKGGDEGTTRYLLNGLAIEMKRRPNKPSPEQREWLSGLEARGWEARVCYSAEEAWTVICDYFSFTI
jgi:hypothetical protein